MLSTELGASKNDQIPRSIPLRASACGMIYDMLFRYISIQVKRFNINLVSFVLVVSRCFTMHLSSKSDHRSARQVAVCTTSCWKERVQKVDGSVVASEYCDGRQVWYWEFDVSHQIIQYRVSMSHSNWPVVADLMWKPSKTLETYLTNMFSSFQNVVHNW